MTKSEKKVMDAVATLVPMIWIQNPTAHEKLAKTEAELKLSTSYETMKRTRR